MYGYETLDHDDPFIDMANKVLSSIDLVTKPGYVIEAIPWREFFSPLPRSHSSWYHVCQSAIYLHGSLTRAFNETQPSSEATIQECCTLLLSMLSPSWSVRLATQCSLGLIDLTECAWRSHELRFSLAEENHYRKTVFVSEGVRFDLVRR